jgi:DNA modification methylase
MTWLTVLIGDNRVVLDTLPERSVHCVVTSPPYWGLRDYGTATWEGGDEGCDHVGAKKKTRYDYALDSSPIQQGSRTGTDARVGMWKDACPSCGARRIDAQLGLEATPEAYVANMVDVFRKVRRVLRDDGTLWLNLGDSYAANGVSGLAIKGETSTLVGTANHAHTAQPKSVPSGLKPKDLVGIPWMVARALQAPYYTGRIKSEGERIWLAAMIDAEGCLYIHRRQAGLSNGQGYVRKADTHGAGLEVSNTSEAIVQRCLDITGRGSISRQEKDRRQPLYRWNLRTNECRDVVREVYPHLVAKRQQARILIGCPSSGEKAEAAFLAMQALHHGSGSTVDFAEPESMYEPGWYLRSDVVWSKPNPMPESVTDRPTKSHEYVFLLSKSPRYFFDQEAVREPHATWVMRNGEMVHTTGGGRLDGRGTQHLNTSGPMTVAGAHPAGRNIRSVWTIPTTPWKGAHFAVFPPALVEPCVKAGTSERGVCPECGAPWERVVEREGAVKNLDYGRESRSAMQRGGIASTTLNGVPATTTTTGWRPSCAHDAEAVPATVLDPFAGSGTVGVVANKLSRRAVLIDLNPEYLEQIERRNQQAPLGLAG